MSHLEEIKATVALLNDRRGRGGQAKLARRVPCDVRTVRGWTNEKRKPLPTHMERVRTIRAEAERQKEKDSTS